MPRSEKLRLDLLPISKSSPDPTNIVVFSINFLDDPVPFLHHYLVILPPDYFSMEIDIPVFEHAEF